MIRMLLALPTSYGVLAALAVPCIGFPATLGVGLSHLNFTTRQVYSYQTYPSAGKASTYVYRQSISSHY